MHDMKRKEGGEGNKISESLFDHLVSQKKYGDLMTYGFSDGHVTEVFEQYIQKKDGLKPLSWVVDLKRGRFGEAAKVLYDMQDHESQSFPRKNTLVSIAKLAQRCSGKGEEDPLTNDIQEMARLCTIRQDVVSAYTFKW